MPFPSPETRHPVIMPDGTPHLGSVFLTAAIDHPRWEVGDYSYASAHQPPDDWAFHLAPYLYSECPERLIIGKFVQIADGVKFITASANHRYDGFSSYPFAIFDGMDRARPSLQNGPWPDTTIGNDVWIGQGARLMPGCTIGNGVIIGAGSVVAGTVPDYAIVVGNPAKIVRMRFDDKTISQLLEIAWWEWQIETILAHEAAICGADLKRLQAIDA